GHTGSGTFYTEQLNGEFVITYSNTQFCCTSGQFNGQVGLITSASNPQGLPVGTIVLSYGTTQNITKSTAIIGLNSGNGTSYTTLTSLGIGGTDGTVASGQYSLLAGQAFAFEPTAGAQIPHTAGAGFAASSYAGLSTYGANTTVLSSGTNVV